MPERSADLAPVALFEHLSDGSRQALHGVVLPGCEGKHVERKVDVVVRLLSGQGLKLGHHSRVEQ